MGRNISCDLYNEHVNKLVKGIIRNMGPNLTENALQRAARSVSTLDLVCKQFDRESNVPVTALAHTTRTDINDIQKVVMAVLDNELQLSLGDGTGVFQQCDSIQCGTGKERILLNGLTKRRKTTQGI